MYIISHSYDSTVRIFDVRKHQSPLTQVDVGGGVWRVKWHPLEARKNDLLIACMHDGFKTLRLDIEGLRDHNPAGEIGELHVTKRYDDHQSLAYGVDWSFAGGENGQSLIASCSFYDHALHLWLG